MCTKRRVDEWCCMRYHSGMVRKGKLLESARSRPASLKFKELCMLVEAVGYVFDRQTGSHRIYRHQLRREVPMVNIQEGKHGDAKPYQVKQVLQIIDAFDLEVDE